LDGVSPEPTLRFTLLRERSKRVRQWESALTLSEKSDLFASFFFAESSQWRGFGLLPSVSSEERVSKFIFAEKSSPSTWWSFRVFRCSRFGKSHRAKSFFTFCASRHLQSARLGAFLSHVRVAAFLSLAQADSLRKKNRQDFALHFEEAVDFVLLWLNDSEDLDSQRKSQRQTDGQFMLT